MIRQLKAEQQLILQEVNDQATLDRGREQNERAKQNSRCGCKQTGLFYYRKPAEISGRGRAGGLHSPTQQVSSVEYGPSGSSKRTMGPSASTSFRKGGCGSMRIDGEWRVCDDGITRPAIQAKVQAANGAFHVEFFLVDSGADRARC